MIFLNPRPREQSSWRLEKKETGGISGGGEGGKNCVHGRSAAAEISFTHEATGHARWGEDARGRQRAKIRSPGKILPTLPNLPTGMPNDWRLLFRVFGKILGCQLLLPNDWICSNNFTTIGNLVFRTKLHYKSISSTIRLSDQTIQ